MNTIQYSPEAVRYMQQVFSWTHRSLRGKRHLDRFSRFCRTQSIGDRPIDDPTDHATRSVTKGGAHGGEAKVCYCVWLQQVFIGAVDSTDRINFSNQQLYSAVRLDGLQFMWRHTTTQPRRERFPPAYPTGDTTVYLFTEAQAI